MRYFHHKLDELFQARCEKTTMDSAAWPPPRGNSSAGARGTGPVCDEVVRVSVPFAAMHLDSSYYGHARAARAQVLARLS